MKKVFKVTVEVKPMEGTQLPSDCARALVNIYLATNDIKEAIDTAESTLLEDCYKPICTYEAVHVDLDEYDFGTDEEGCPDNSDLEAIQKTGEIIYSPFFVFPNEEE